MKLLLRRYAILLAVLLCWPVATHAQEVLPVKKIEIQHKGPPAASDDFIRSHIRIKEGDPYTRVGSDADVRSLMATRRFYNVRAMDNTSGDGVEVTYVFWGQPTISEIKFVGNEKYSRNRLQKKIATKSGDTLDETKLFQDRQTIRELYQKAGRQKTEVRYDLYIDESTAKCTVTFQIAESPKVKIKRVDYVGAKSLEGKSTLGHTYERVFGKESFTRWKLWYELKTRRWRWYSVFTSGGVLKDDEFQDDKEKIAEVYREQGFIDFELKDVRFDTPKTNWMKVQFVVSEGRQYKVGALEFKGNELFRKEEILRWIKDERINLSRQRRPGPAPKKGLQLAVGETFTPGGLDDDLEAIRDFYGAKGYIDAFVIAKRTPNIDTGTMDLVYQIEEGGKSSIYKIEVRGNTKTKDKVIRRELAVSPGEVFDMMRVKLSERRLEGLRYFDKVETFAEPTDMENRKNLVVSVEEGTPAHVAVGAGFSTVENLFGYVEFTQGNFDLLNPPFFMGGGQKLRLIVQVGTSMQNYQISFVEPWLLDRKLEFSTDLYHREVNYYSSWYDERRTGMKLKVRRALYKDYLIGSASYTIENVGILDVDNSAPADIWREQGYNLISKVGGSIALDTRNKVGLPDKGQITELEGIVAGGPFGGDKDFYKLELNSSWYFKGLFRGHVLQFAGQTGVVDHYGSSDHVPIFDRWYLGGAYDMRGYRYRHAGADDTFQSGEPVGGGTYWYGTAEYSVPVVVDNLRFAVFYDVGNVYRDSYYYDFRDYLDNWGVGLRIDIPYVGPLRLDYGVPINSGTFTGDAGKFQFSVGWDRRF